MRKLLTILFIACLLPLNIFAQDARHRTATTIIADALAQLPASDEAKYNEVMGEIASTGEEGIIELCSFLSPAEQGKNAIFEYALNGVVSYVSAQENAALREGVRKGLVAALDKCDDYPNKAFLLTLLQNCPAQENLSVFLKYLSDPYLADWAANGIIFLPDADKQIMGLLKDKSVPRATLAYAVEKRNLQAAVPTLIKWLKDADEPTTAAIYKALARCGTPAALQPLRAAAKAVDYDKDPTGATDSYLILLNTLATNGEEKSAGAEAKKLLADVDKSNVRCAAICIIFTVEGKQAENYLMEALSSDDRAYRVAALRAAECFADEDTYSSIGALLAEDVSDEVKEDVVNWFGANKISSEIDALIPCISSDNDALACAAIKAAGQIGGEKALEALTLQLNGANGSHVPETTAALLAFNGDISSAMVQALDSDAAQEPILNIISRRHILPADEIVALIQKKDNVQTYYPILALVGTPAAIDEIMKGYAGAYKEEAFRALLNISSEEMIDLLYNIAASDEDHAAAALLRYNALVSAADYTAEEKYALYSKALEATSDERVENAIINSLAALGLTQSLPIVEQYIEQPSTALNAAYATRSLVAQNIDHLTTDEARSALEKAKAYLSTIDDADAGYTVEDINNLLSKLDASSDSAPSTNLAQLSAEEQEDGFLLLFDGETMNGWTGNTIDYVPLDGTINVSAEYGGEGNLYTVKEYSDFIFRFEFRYNKEGVNNGVGIRTPMGVDAAYEGMEIQILDHDAPIYKDLREYQQHGSVYGIIPAKRVKFPPLGTWNTEEIIALGNHITVTVNGEVILDGDIYEACEGHNVSEDGSETNPYTVDHLNHPGLFNKSGHVGFLGHGEGLQLRNIRIKDLSE